MKAKRILASFLALLLLATMLPTAAFAAGPAPVTIDLNGSNSSGSGYVMDEYTLTITGDGSYRLTASAGGVTARSVIVQATNAHITLSNVSIVAGTIGVPFSISSGSTVNLTLEGYNALRYDDSPAGSGAGLYVPAGATVIIDGTGALTATGKKDSSKSGAGIGGMDANGHAGSITINNGTVTATGGTYSAGIGGGTNANGTVSGNGGTITINGGVVTATGASHASGIGGACRGAGGNITINGGTVTATGGPGSAGIGGGFTGDTGNILISGGFVTAIATGVGSGIGRAPGDTAGSSGGGSILISGGTVFAKGVGTGIPGLGSWSSYTDTNGTYYDTTTLRITGGSVRSTPELIAQPDGAATEPIYLTTVSVMGMGMVSKELYYKMDGGNPSGVRTDEAGKLYFWLTAGMHTLALIIDGQLYETALTVAASNGNPHTLNAAPDGSFVPVSSIGWMGANGPEPIVDVPFDLSSTLEITPYNATYDSIVWSIEDAGSTGASLSGSVLTASSTGNVQLKATIKRFDVALKSWTASIAVKAASGTPGEQFSLTPGGTYYFDLSGQGIEGTLAAVGDPSASGSMNPNLPDGSLKWVPFTYAGTVNAYSRSSAGVSTGSETVSDRSLFVSNYNVAQAAPWISLDSAGLIFGKNYGSGGVSYKLRSLSVGSSYTGTTYGDGEATRGVPASNEWDQILNKNAGFIKNYNGLYSLGQDTASSDVLYGARGNSGAHGYYSIFGSSNHGSAGFRPALEIASAPGTELKTVIYNMSGNGTLGSGTLTSATVVYTSSLTLPEITSANGFTYTGTGAGILGWYAGSTFYAPGTTPALATGTILTAGYSGSAPAITTTSLPGGTVGTAYSQTLAATGTTPITWSIDSGSLPGGLSLNGSSGAISGIPAATGTFNFTVKAENSKGTVTQALSITIDPRPAPTEQFSLALGGIYYFDLSGQGIPGTVNTNLPDTGLKWVPFTYVGTVNAYSLDASSSGNPAASAAAIPSEHSLFVADYNVVHATSWGQINSVNLIFGKNYGSGNASYKLRSLSVGSDSNQQTGEALRGTPVSNEWDQILNKNEAYLKNWSAIISLGQDTPTNNASYRALRGYDSARGWYFTSASNVGPYCGFRPVLEVLNPDILGSDGLKTVTYNMNGNGTLGSGSLTSATVVYTGALTLPAITPANGFAYTGSGTGILGWYTGGTFYAPGAILGLPTGATLTPGYETPAGTAPTINGPTALTLTEGYGAASTDAYIIAGTAPVTVSKTSGDAKIVWNDATKKLDVAAGLAAGSYPVTLKASNGISPDATLTFTLTVNAVPVMDAAISPASVSYDLASPTDISTNITWNSATTVTGVVYGSDTLVSPADYTVSVSALTIKNSYLRAKGFSAGNKAEFTISFDKGNSAMLTVNSVNNYTPGTNADLSNLAVGGSTVSGFDPGILSYNVELPYDTLPGSAAATVGSTAADPKAGISVTQAVYLPGSAAVAVTAENGTKKIYTVSFTLKAAPPVQSSEKDVTSVITPSSAAINGTSIMATVANSVTSQAINLSVSAKSSWKLYSDALCQNEVADKIMALSVGANTAYVQVMAENGSTKVYTLTITRQDSVLSVSVTGVTLNRSTLSLTMGRSSTLAATVAPADATNKAVTWNSNAPGVASVSITGVVTAISAGTATITVTTADGGKTDICTVTVTRASGGGGDTGGTGGGSGGSAAITPTSYNASVSGTDASGKEIAKSAVDITVNSENASMKIGSEQSASITAGSKVIITVPSIPNVTAYTVGMPAESLSNTAGQGSLTLQTDAGSMMLPANMLANTGATGKTAELSIAAGDKAVLAEAVKAAIGNRPLVQLALKIDGKEVNWNNPEAPVTVSIPYTPSAAELANPESIVIWYIDGSGNAISIPNGHYDPATGTVTFTTTHFSNYAVGYNKVSFTDVSARDWFSKAVGFIAARKITTGTGSGNYSPDAKLTRGEFIVMLLKAYDIAPDTNAKDNFTDAGNTYYTGYLAAAKRLGISGGIGNNMFAPGKEITRQEMFTLLYNALKVIGRLPEGKEGKDLTAFSDVGDIASWAKDAMTLFVKTGTVGGSGGKLSPTATTTRAEMAQVLYNLLSK